MQTLEGRGGKLKRKRERPNIRRIDHTTTLKSVSAKLLMLLRPQDQ
jgi:hypothetical protein